MNLKEWNKTYNDRKTFTMLQALQKADPKQYLSNLEKMGFTKNDTEKQLAAAAILRKLSNEELLAYDAPKFDTVPYEGGIYTSIYLKHPENPLTLYLNSLMKNKELSRYMYQYDISSFGFRKQTEFLEELNKLTFEPNIHRFEFDTTKEKPLFDLFEFVRSLEKMSESLMTVSKAVDLGFEKVVDSIRSISESVKEFQKNHEVHAQIINRNTSRGWTMVGEFDLSDYLNEDILLYSDEELDLYYEELFYKENNKLLEETKENILYNIGNHNKKFAEEVFEAFERGLIKVAIPSLILLIEGTMASIARSTDIGGKLKKQLKDHPIKEQADLNDIIFYTAFLFVTDTLYTWDKFDEPRKPIINRNRILHGRDNPDLWTQTDALRLIVVLATLTFFDELYGETNQLLEPVETV